MPRIFLRSAIVCLTSSIFFQDAAQSQQREFTEEELSAAKSVVEHFGNVFLHDGGEELSEITIPSEAIGRMIVREKPSVEVAKIHQQIIEGNLLRFKEWRAMFADLSKLTVQGFEPGYLLKADYLADDARVMHNAYAVLGYANRIIIKLKIEDLFFYGGKWYIVKLD